MIENKFIWADLSSYQPEKIASFYKAVFGWNYLDENQYLFGYKESKPIVGLYQTPLKFQKIKMPSFWMSYIQVTNVLETTEKAKKNGGIIELIDTKNSFGNIALIRDTLGAGFTVYDGNKLNAKTKSEESTLIYNELHVSNAQKAITFYQNLFNWNFKQISNTAFDVFCNSSQEKVTNIYEIEDRIKGKYQYWACVFGVKNIKISIKKIIENGGLILSKEENRALCSDGSEAFFYIQEV